MEEIIRILESIFGHSDDGLNGNQIMFDCPVCYEENVGKSQKFSVNIGGFYKCWRCGDTHNTKGLLTSAIKKHGSLEQLKLYKEAVKSFKSSKEYELDFVNNNLSIIEEEEEEKIMFPDHTYSFKFDGNIIERDSLNYLINRGFTVNLIKKYGLKYTNNDTNNKIFRNRIIIPSYDKYGELTYYTGRDITGKSKFKYYNCENSKRKDTIFNESLINLDADIYIVEGPLDSICVPNSIPLMGKSLNFDDYLFQYLLKNANQDIIIFLDSDALEDSKAMCERLVNYGLCDRIKYIKTNKLLEIINRVKKLNLDKLDPGKLFEIGGYKAVSWSLTSAKLYPCI